MQPYLTELTQRLGNALANRLVGVYLTGSAAVGAFRPGSSDLDVLVAVSGAEPAQLDEIIATCSHAALPCPATKLELVVYELESLEAPGQVPRWSLNFDTGAHEHHVNRDPLAEPAHWFVVDLEFARRNAVALVGPPAAELIGPAAAGAVEEALDEIVAWYRERGQTEAADAAARRSAHWRSTREFMPKPVTGS